MPWNGSGTFGRQYGSSGWVNDRNAGTKILATRHDTNDDDLADGINNCLTKDGQNAATANLPMGGFKHTSVASASLRDQYASAGQVTDGGLVYLTPVSGTNTILASATPAITAYAAGQAFRFIPANSITGATTININGVGAKSITKRGTTALSSGDITAGSVVEIVYDGTQFQLASPVIPFPFTTAEITTTGGTSVEFTGIPAWATKIYALIRVMSGSAANGAITAELGTASSYETTGYQCGARNVAAATFTSSSTNIPLNYPLTAAADAWRGVLSLYLELPSANGWVLSSVMTSFNGGTANEQTTMTGYKDLTGALTRIRFLIATGTYDLMGIALRIEP